MIPFKKYDIKKISNILAFSVTLIPLVLFLFIVWNRISMPFVFEWGESAGVDQINRILSGVELYSQPSQEFAPLVYTPLYYFLAAGLSLIIGSVLLSARIISLVALIISVILIGRLIYNETRNPLLAWISGMSYIACFAISDGFYDLARVDSVYILLVLIAFSVIQRSKTSKGYLIAGLLLAIGFFTKQSFLIVFFPLLIYHFLKKWKQSWTMIVTVIAGLVIPFILIVEKSNSWFFYYIFELPKEHGYSLVSAANFWIGDTLRPLGLFVVFGLVFLMTYKILQGESQTLPDEISKTGVQITFTESRERWWIYVLFFMGATAAAWVTRSSNGGGANNGMVFYAALAITFGLGAGLVLRTKWVQENSWHYAFILFVISIQFIGLIYNPFNFLPKDDDIRSHEEIVSRIRSSEKQVLIPYRSHLTEEYGLGSQIHIVNLFELTGYFKGEVQLDGYLLVDQISANICWQEYGLIVLDQPVPWFDKQIEIAYFLDPDTRGLDFQQSELLKWQQGFLRTYIPRVDYNRDNCLNSISIGLQ